MFVVRKTTNNILNIINYDEFLFEIIFNTDVAFTPGDNRYGFQNTGIKTEITRYVQLISEQIS